MDQLIISGRVFGGNVVSPLLTRFFEHKDIEKTNINTASILLNGDMAADWVKNCDAIYLKYTTQSVPSGLDVSNTFTVYQYNPSNCISISDATNRVAQSDLSAFSNIVHAIACIFDYNVMHCKYLDMFFKNEGNQEDRYTITIANRGKELYKGGLNSDTDFNNATEYITKSIIHEALEKFRVFPYKDIHVTVEDNALKNSYTFCVCGKTNIDNISEYSAIKTNIRFINFMNSSIKYDDKDAVAKSMVTRFCAIVMQIAAAIENNYGKSTKDNEEDPDVIRIVCEAYDEEKSFEAAYNAETGKFTRYIAGPPFGTIEYTMKNLMFMYPQTKRMTIQRGSNGNNKFIEFIVFDNDDRAGSNIETAIPRSNGRVLEYFDTDKENREFSTSVRNIVKDAVREFLTIYANNDEYSKSVQLIMDPPNVAIFRVYRLVGDSLAAAVVPGEKCFKVLSDNVNEADALSPYLWESYEPSKIIKDFYRAEVSLPKSNLRPFILWHYINSCGYEIAELMIISAYDRLMSYTTYMKEFYMTDEQEKYVKDSVVKIMDIISSCAFDKPFASRYHFDIDEFKILGGGIRNEVMRFIFKEQGLCVSNNMEEEGTGFNSLYLKTFPRLDSLFPDDYLLVSKSVAKKEGIINPVTLTCTGYEYIDRIDWLYRFVNSNEARICVEIYDGIELPEFTLWSDSDYIDQCNRRAYEYIMKYSDMITLSMKYNFLVVINRIVCQFTLRAKKHAHEYNNGTYNQIKNSVEIIIGVGNEYKCGKVVELDDILKKCKDFELDDRL